jgi:hypothetical protein
MQSISTAPMISVVRGNGALSGTGNIAERSMNAYASRPEMSAA